MGLVGRHPCPATTVFPPVAPPPSHLPKARPSSLYTLLPMSPSSSPGRPGAPLPPSQMALVLGKADEEERRGFGGQGPTPEPRVPEIQKDAPSCVPFCDLFLELFINICGGYGCYFFSEKGHVASWGGVPEQTDVSALPRITSPISFKPGGAPAASAWRRPCLER